MATTKTGSKTARLIENSDVTRTVQDCLEHKDVKTTMVCTHMVSQGLSGVRTLL